MLFENVVYFLQFSFFLQKAWIRLGMTLQDTIMEPQAIQCIQAIQWYQTTIMKNIKRQQLLEVKVRWNGYFSTFHAYEQYNITITLNILTKIVFSNLDCPRVQFKSSPDMKNGDEHVSITFPHSESLLPKSKSPQKVAFAIPRSDHEEDVSQR